MANVTNHMQSLVDLSPLQIDSKNSIRHMLYLGRCNVVHLNKSFLLMMIVQSIWLHQPTYKLSMKVVFPSKKLFVEEVLLVIRGKTLATYVQPTLATCIFDLWMSTRAHEMFTVIVNFYEVIGSPNM